MHFLHIGKTENIKQIRKGKILFLDVGVNHIRKRAENCQPKSGKDKDTNNDYRLQITVFLWAIHLSVVLLLNTLYL